MLLKAFFDTRHGNDFRNVLPEHLSAPSPSNNLEDYGTSNQAYTVDKFIDQAGSTPREPNIRDAVKNYWRAMRGDRDGWGSQESWEKFNNAHHLEEDNPYEPGE